MAPKGTTSLVSFQVAMSLSKLKVSCRLTYKKIPIDQRNKVKKANFTRWLLDVIKVGIEAFVDIVFAFTAAYSAPA